VNAGKKKEKQDHTKKKGTSMPVRRR